MSILFIADLYLYLIGCFLPETLLESPGKLIVRLLLNLTLVEETNSFRKTDFFLLTLSSGQERSYFFTAFPSFRLLKNELYLPLFTITQRVKQENVYFMMLLSPYLVHPVWFCDPLRTSQNRLAR
jgi:hypothetical protein